MENKLIPNSTQIPNIILDLILPKLPEAEARCLLYISRRTFGFHRDNDRISFSQFENGIISKDGLVLDVGTGLSRPSISQALSNLFNAEIINILKSSKGNFYAINLNIDPDKVVKRVNQLRELTRSGKATLPKQVKLLNTQKKEKQRETKVYTLLEIFDKEIQTDNLKEKQKFLDYWTEKNTDAKKERWQKQQAFDVKRRWKTWLDNCKEWGKEEKKKPYYFDDPVVEKHGKKYVINDGE
jgi:DNA-binding transcriptional ArsR family regulator